MTDPSSWDDSLSDIETLVRSAGGYVSASDNLRPRVLEAARAQCSERRTQSCLRRVALFVVLLAVFTTVLRSEQDVSPFGDYGQSMMTNFEELIVPAAASTPRNGDADWRIIDAFTRLRRQQAQLLRFQI